MNVDVYANPRCAVGRTAFKMDTRVRGSSNKLRTAEEEAVLCRSASSCGRSFVEEHKLVLDISRKARLGVKTKIKRLMVFYCGRSVVGSCLSKNTPSYCLLSTIVHSITIGY